MPSRVGCAVAWQWRATLTACWRHGLEGSTTGDPRSGPALAKLCRLSYRRPPGELGGDRHTAIPARPAETDNLKISAPAY